MNDITPFGRFYRQFCEAVARREPMTLMCYNCFYYVNGRSVTACPHCKIEMMGWKRYILDHVAVGI